MRSIIGDFTKNIYISKGIFSDFSYNVVGFMDQNSKPPELEDKVKYYFIFN